MRRQFSSGSAWVSVISHLRPANVPKMQALIGHASWYVGVDEGAEYKAAGAGRVIEAGGLCESRNAALQEAWSHDMPCIELSDDLRALKLAQDKKTVHPLGFDDAVDIMATTSRGVGARLAGVAPTNNPFYFNPNRPLHTRAFVVGDFIMVRPCGLIFDERMKLKEDYDYTLQHLHTFGRVARCNSILATFAHRSNAGGACDFRTPAREQDAIAFLKSRWGASIKDNPRRPNEIVLKL